MSSDNRGGASAPTEAQQQVSSKQGQTDQQPATSDKPNASDNKQGAALFPDATAIVTNATELQTERDQQRADDDLQAQQDMALYALFMVIATVATVLVTAVGVWFVKRTLDATLQAVQDTSEATQAMLDANDIARKHGQMQLRAYLRPAIERHPVWEVGRQPEAVVSLTNHGQTPAYNVKHITCFDWGGFPDPPFPDITGDPVPCIIHPGTGGTINISWPDPLTEDDMTILCNGTEARAYLFGKVSYEDAFGTQRSLRYRFQMGGAEMLRVGYMHIAPQGNEGD